MGITLNGIVAKVARAHEHFETLRSEFKTARDRREYGLLTDVDPVTGDMVFRIRFPYALRRRWGAAASTAHVRGPIGCPISSTF